MADDEMGTSNGKAKESNGHLAGRIHDVVDQAGFRASKIAHRAKDGAGVQVRRLSDLIVSRPIAAVLTAFGIGFLLSKLHR